MYIFIFQAEEPLPAKNEEISSLSKESTDDLYSRYKVRVCSLCIHVALKLS